MCLAAATDRLSNLQAASFQFMQTVYDSVAFLMILFKTAKDAFGPQKTGNIRAVIAKHGLLYYLVVFSANLTWALMILLSPTGLKYSAAVPTIMMACLSANKMTLSLRAFSEPVHVSEPRHVAKLPGTPRLKRRRSWIGTSTFEIGDTYVPEIVPFNSFEMRSQQIKTGSSASSKTLFND